MIKIVINISQVETGIKIKNFHQDRFVTHDTYIIEERRFQSLEVTL